MKNGSGRDGDEKMRVGKTIATAVAIVAGIAVISRIYIYRTAEERLQTLLSGAASPCPSGLVTKIVKYDNSIFGATATVEAESSGGSGNTPCNGKKFETDIEYGPIPDIGGDIPLASMRVSWSGDLSYLYEPLEGDMRYRAMFGFGDRVVESIETDRVILDHPEGGMKIVGDDMRITIDSTLDGAKSKSRLQSSLLKMEDSRTGETLRMKDAEIESTIYERGEDGVSLGKIVSKIGELSISVPGHPIVKAYAEFESRLKKGGDSLLDMRISNSIVPDESTDLKTAMGIKSLHSEVELRNLGRKGLAEAIEYRKMRDETAQKLAEASRTGDAVALGKALDEYSRLENRLVEIFNDIFISGKSSIRIEEKIVADRESEIILDMLYTGRKLHGDILNAIAEATASLENSLEGSFEFKLERELLRRVYPNAIFILESMVNKGMARLDNGVYLLSGRYEKGRFTINGHSYGPKELIFTILAP